MVTRSKWLVFCERSTQSFRCLFLIPILLWPLKRTFEKTDFSLRNCDRPKKPKFKVANENNRSLFQSLIFQDFQQEYLPQRFNRHFSTSVGLQSWTIFDFILFVRMLTTWKLQNVLLNFHSLSFQNHSLINRWLDSFHRGFNQQLFTCGVLWQKRWIVSVGLKFDTRKVLTTVDNIDKPWRSFCYFFFCTTCFTLLEKVSFDGIHFEQDSKKSYSLRPNSERLKSFGIKLDWFCPTKSVIKCLHKCDKDNKNYPFSPCLTTDTRRMPKSAATNSNWSKLKFINFFQHYLPASLLLKIPINFLLEEDLSYKHQFCYGQVRTGRSCCVRY